MLSWSQVVVKVSLAFVRHRHGNGVQSFGELFLFQDDVVVRGDKVLASAHGDSTLSATSCSLRFHR